MKKRIVRKSRIGRVSKNDNSRVKLVAKMLKKDLARLTKKEYYYFSILAWNGEIEFIKSTDKVTRETAFELAYKIDTTLVLSESDVDRLIKFRFGKEHNEKH